MVEWFTHKIKSINTVLDIGIVLTIVTSLLTILIYAHKITSLYIIGIPLSISLNIIDVKIIDYVISLPIIFLVLLFGLVSYYTLYIKSLYKKIRNSLLVLFVSFLLGIISVMLNIFDINEMIIGLVFFFFSYILSPIYIYAILDRPVDIISKIFEGTEEKDKLLTFMVEVLSISIIIIVTTLFLSNIWVKLPRRITLADNQIIIYSSQDALLVSDYKIDFQSTSTIKKINLDYNTLKITNKEKKYIFTKEKYIIE